VTAIAEDASRERCPAMVLWVEFTQKLKIGGCHRMKEKNLERLYKLLERAEREHDTETAAAIRWAIFELENR
jgi:hypothetical protein